MATQAQTLGWFFRLGRGARRALRGYTRGERQTADWFILNGLPAELAWGAVWAVRLAVVAALLYAAFWVAILAVVLIAAVWMTDDSATDEADIWPFMTWGERRKTLGYDPALYEDIEHPDYPDDNHG